MTMPPATASWMFCFMSTFFQDMSIFNLEGCFFKLHVTLKVSCMFTTKMRNVMKESKCLLLSLSTECVMIHLTNLRAWYCRVLLNSARGLYPRTHASMASLILQLPREPRHEWHISYKLRSIDSCKLLICTSKHEDTRAWFWGWVIPIYGMFGLIDYNYPLSL